MTKTAHEIRKELAAKKWLFAFEGVGVFGGVRRVVAG